MLYKARNLYQTVVLTGNAWYNHNNSSLKFVYGAQLNEKARKSFTFWFALVGIIGVILNVTGFDDVGLFIGFNPVLNVLSGSKACCDVINSVSHLWYILSMITMIVYGLVIDALKSLIRKK